jgi:drug/metabolite transporter (DMT)-like permease
MNAKFILPGKLVSCNFWRQEYHLIPPAIFGLLAALFWGTTDFLSRFASRKIGYGYSTAYMQLFSLIGFSVFIAIMGVPSIGFISQGVNYMLLDILVGALNVLGLMLLYRAFSIGNMSLTAPIAGSFPIFTILFGFILLGQGIGLEKGIAIAIVISGVILSGVSPGPGSSSTQVQKKRNSSGVLSALLASIFFGAAYLGLNYGASYFGSVLSVWFVRVGAVLFSFPFLLLTMKKLVLPKSGAWKWLIVMATLDSAGFTALTLGYIYSGDSPALVTTLSSLLGAVTTILATAIYKDKLSKIQIIGIVVLFAGVVIVLNV